MGDACAEWIARNFGSAITRETIDRIVFEICCYSTWRGTVLVFKQSQCQSCLAKARKQKKNMWAYEMIERRAIIATDNKKHFPMLNIVLVWYKRKHVACEHDKLCTMGRLVFAHEHIVWFEIEACCVFFFCDPGMFVLFHFQRDCPYILLYLEINVITWNPNQNRCNHFSILVCVTTVFDAWAEISVQCDCIKVKWTFLQMVFQLKAPKVLTRAN